MMLTNVVRNTLRNGVSHTVNANVFGCPSCRTSTAAATFKNDNTDMKIQISIPKRIKRNPTDMLTALKSTIRHSQANPHYKYHDDPYLIPTSNFAKRTYALSRESGRKSAKWIRNQYPDAFVNKIDDPQIERLMPKFEFDKNTATVNALIKCISTADVSGATSVFNLLTSEGKTIGDGIKQSYLELQCFYNGLESTDDELLEERWYRNNLLSERKTIWAESNPAEVLFQNMDVKDERAYSAMICGLTKFSKWDKAFMLYSKMKELNLPISTIVYNHIIPCVIAMKETSESRWQLLEEILKNMNDEDVQPDLYTMNAILETISRFGSWKDTKKLALQTFSEMKYLGIEPSLGSYCYLLDIFCRPKGPISTILYDIMDILRDKDLVNRHPKDCLFFIAAMEVCHMHLQDIQLAYDVNRLLNHGNNYCLIGDAMRESIYYQHFFKILCLQENMQTFFEVYNNLTPHIYTPEVSVMIEIIKAIALNGAAEHLPSIWSDIILFEMSNRKDILEEFLKAMALNKPSDSVASNQWITAVWDLKTRVENETGRRSNQIYWTGDMIGNVLTILLNCDDYEKACLIMKQCHSESLNISGLPSEEQLMAFGKATIQNQDAKNGLLCCKYMIDGGYLNGASLAKEILDQIQMSDEIRTSLKEIASAASPSKEQ